MEDIKRINEIKQRLNYLDREIANGTEDMEEYYEAVELHKELRHLTTAST